MIRKKWKKKCRSIHLKTWCLCMWQWAQWQNSTVLVWTVQTHFRQLDDTNWKKLVQERRWFGGIGPSLGWQCLSWWHWLRLWNLSQTSSTWRWLSSRSRWRPGCRQWWQSWSDWWQVLRVGLVSGFHQTQRWRCWMFHPVMHFHHVKELKEVINTAVCTTRVTPTFLTIF